MNYLDTLKNVLYQFLKWIQKQWRWYYTLTATWAQKKRSLVISLRKIFTERQPWPWKLCVPNHMKICRSSGLSNIIHKVTVIMMMHLNKMKSLVMLTVMKMKMSMMVTLFVNTRKSLWSKQLGQGKSAVQVGMTNVYYGQDTCAEQLLSPAPDTKKMMLSSIPLVQDQADCL